MKVYIHTDIEGIAGWALYASLENGSFANVQHTQRMNELLSQEVAAACRAALDEGADEVRVNDSHGVCHNIFVEQLPERCQLIHGRPGYFDAWLGAFEKPDALVCLGQHAMAATPGAVCPHSMWHIQAGRQHLKLGEGTMAAALAGSRGVPCVCFTGDDKVCAEAQARLPGVEAVTVKWGISAQNARTLTPGEARQRIYAGVRAGLQRRRNIQPFVLKGPFRINISNRDPAVKIFAEDIAGNELWETVHRALNQTGYGHYGQDPIDDRSYRWPLDTPPAPAPSRKPRTTRPRRHS